MTTTEVETAKELHRRGRYSEAIRVLKGAEARDPRDEDILLQLAACYSAMGLHAMAVEYETRAANGAPASPAVWTAMGFDLLRIGDLVRSAGAYRRALELDPGLAGAAYSLARVAAMRGDTQLAREALTRALALSPDLASQAKNDEPLAKLLEDPEFRKGNTGRRRS